MSDARGAPARGAMAEDSRRGAFGPFEIWYVLSDPDAMEALVRAVVGVLLVAHGLVHLLYLAPAADDPSYPFTLRRSWLVPEPARRRFATALAVSSVAAFTLLALAVWGVPGLVGAWPVLAVVAAAGSLALLVAFWDVRLSLGVIIDVAVLLLALVRPEWTQRLTG